MHWIHLTYRTSQVSLAYLKGAQNTYIRAKSSKQSLFYNKVLTISCNLLNSVLNVKNIMAVWEQKSSVSKHWLFTLTVSWLTGGLWVAVLPSTQKNPAVHTASQGKDGNSKFEVSFLLNTYLICIIRKLKNFKLNHCK